MARKTERAKPNLNSEELADLKRIARSQTRPAREAQRAKILLHYHSGASITNIRQLVGISLRYSQMLCAKKLSGYYILF